MRLILALLTLGLLAFVAACDNGDDVPPATDTPAADAPTATVAIDPTTPPDATATPPGLTSTPRPDVEGACPVDDEAFCELAGVIDQAIQTGDVDPILANTRLSSQSCSGFAQIGPCVGVNEGVVISGYLVGVDGSDGISYYDEESYLQLLNLLSMSQADGVDGFGDGAWKLVAVVDEGPDEKVLVTTSIDNDPIAFEPASDRRVFLFRLERVENTWHIRFLLTTASRDFYLTGLNADGSAFEDWLPWGED